MARLIFEGLSYEQAKELARWYEGQGEQNADIWFECRGDIEAPMSDVQHSDGYMTEDEVNQTIIARLK